MGTRTRAQFPINLKQLVRTTRTRQGQTLREEAVRPRLQRGDRVIENPRFPKICELAEHFVGAEPEFLEKAWHAIDDLPEDARANSPAIRIRMRAAAGLERWDMVEILAINLQYREACHREEAANAFHALEPAHLSRGYLDKARGIVRTAVKIWPEQRLHLIDDPGWTPCFRPTRSASESKCILIPSDPGCWGASDPDGKADAGCGASPGCRAPESTPRSGVDTPDPRPSDNMEVPKDDLLH